MLRETKSYKQTKNLILSNNSFYTLAGAALEKGRVSVECKSTYSISVCMYLLVVIVVEQFFTEIEQKLCVFILLFFTKGLIFRVIHCVFPVSIRDLRFFFLVQFFSLYPTRD